MGAGNVNSGPSEKELAVIQVDDSMSVLLFERIGGKHFPNPAGTEKKRKEATQEGSRQTKKSNFNPSFVSLVR